MFSAATSYHSSSSQGFVYRSREVFVISISQRNSTLRTVPSSAVLARILRKGASNVEYQRWKMKAVDSRISHNMSTSSSEVTASVAPTIEIPVSCYQLLGVSDLAEKDEIVKSTMQLKRLEADEGYSVETTMYRQDLLMDVRDKLLFEPEYAGNKKENIRPKSTLRIPLAWLPGAVCLLQEVGEVKLVLEIGQKVLGNPDVKPYVHDVLLAMSLAECAIAKINFEKNKVSVGFEALARAQNLLRSKASLEKLPLLSEIEDSLEELAPACTLDILGLPQTSENSERRQGAIGALKELLRQGLEVEMPSRVPDWPYFLAQALHKLTANDIIELQLWNDLADVRKNKKSIESQSQRVIIDFNCFYCVLLAHVAIGFSKRQLDLIKKARTMCEFLMASDGVDLKFEEAFCMFLLGQCSENEVVDRFQQLESSSNPAAQNLLIGKQMKDATGGKTLLEKWLRDRVLSGFPDTQGYSPSLACFFQGDKKNAIKRPQVTSPVNRSVSNWPGLVIGSRRNNAKESLSPSTSSSHLPSTYERSSPAELQNSSVPDQNQEKASEPSTVLKRSFSSHNNAAWASLFMKLGVVGKISAVALLGCIGIMAFQLTGKGFKLIASSLYSTKVTNERWSFISQRDSHTEPSDIGLHGIGFRMGKILQLATPSSSKFSEGNNLQKVRTSQSPTVVVKQMLKNEAEELVNKWQMIKAEALGPNYLLKNLRELLDESMLHQWLALADAAKAKSCYWRFVLLQLSVLRAEISSDKFGIETAEIEALIEEAAELVDKSQSKNPNYCSSYKVRYFLKKHDDGTWRFCKVDIQTPT